jgi:hypothetical protein
MREDWQDSERPVERISLKTLFQQATFGATRSRKELLRRRENYQWLKIQNIRCSREIIKRGGISSMRPKRRNSRDMRGYKQS